MIFDSSTLKLPLTLRTDVVVVGSGAGGSAAAMAMAEAGLDVLVLEAGNFVAPDCMTQREEQMLPELLLANGGQTTTDRAVKIHQGRSVGGSTMHNINLVKRIPDAILAHWRRDRGLEHLPPERWATLYDEVEALLQVSQVPPEKWSRHNRILEAGCQALGWAGGGLSHNRTGCVGSGFCLLGCAFDAKNNATKVVLPRAIRAGAQLLASCQAVRIDVEGGRARGVQAVALDPRTRRPLGEITVRADHVVVAASATGTAALLLRSRIPDPGGETGNTLRIHPALVAAGLFEEPVRAWTGIPQTYECTEFLRFDDESEQPGSRTWIVPAFAHPVGTATMLPGHGETHAQSMAAYDRLAVLTGMIHDQTRGRVRPSGDLGWKVDYWPDAADRRELVFGMARCAELLFAAGASSVSVPTEPLRVLERPDQVDELDRVELTRGMMDITAVHPMGSVPMGDDPLVAAVGSDGAHHHVAGLWVADGSLFPTSIGVPPQLSIYAMGLHVGEAVSNTEAG